MNDLGGEKSPEILHRPDGCGPGQRPPWRIPRTGPCRVARVGPTCEPCGNRIEALVVVDVTATGTLGRS